MSSGLGSEAFASFQSRLIMRLHLLQADRDNFLQELVNMQGFVKDVPQTVCNASDKDDFLKRLNVKSFGDNADIQACIESLEGVTELTWEEAFNIQERYIQLLMLHTEKSSQIRDEFFEFLKTVCAVAFRKAQSTSRKKAPEPKVDPVGSYVTPSIEAMQAAIKTFWLSYDPSNIPTQKMVSNFIAEQLGEPIRNRFSDELARAIKPDNL